MAQPLKAAQEPVMLHTFGVQVHWKVQVLRPLRSSSEGIHRLPEARGGTERSYLGRIERRGSRSLVTKEVGTNNNNTDMVFRLQLFFGFEALVPE